MKTFKFKSFGEDREVYFYLDRYEMNDATYIGAMMIEDGDEDYYGDVSINIPHGKIDNANEFYANRDSDQLIKAMLKAKLIEDTDDTVSSGYAVYNKMRTTEKFMEYVKANESEVV